VHLVGVGQRGERETKRNENRKETKIEGKKTGKKKQQIFIFVHNGIDIE